MTTTCDDKYFEYLDNLRESGETNMFGAGAYLQDAFNLRKNDASKILVRWMGAFSKKG